jgi:dolichol-phosphate mannosyltransferase
MLISVVIPVLNELENIPHIYAEISRQFQSLRTNFEVVFVCDPSSDGSEEFLRSISKKHKNIIVVLLADRAGQSECIRIGYLHAKGDAVITMDSDFQDPPDLLPTLVNLWKKGNLIVHTKRSERLTDDRFYVFFVSFGYWLLKYFTNGKVMPHVGDYRLIDRRVKSMILTNEDPNPFWRGITNLSGIKSTVVSYSRESRSKGGSKYHKKFGSPTVAFRGLVSFSSKPLNYLQGIGVVALFVALFAFIVNLFFVLSDNDFQRGIPTLIFVIVIFFAIQFVSTAIIATYILVLVEQTRNRKKFLIKEVINF